MVWSTLASIAGAGIGSFFKKGASKLGDTALDSLANQFGQKINGIPSHLTGAQLGQQQKSYMDAAFPGTNPWERLGQSSALTPVEVAKEQRNTQREVLRTQRQNVQEQTSAQRDVARIGQQTMRERMAVDQAMLDRRLGNESYIQALNLGTDAVSYDDARKSGRYGGNYKGPKPYWATPTEVNAGRLAAEKPRIAAETQLAINRALTELERAEETKQDVAMKSAKARLAKAFASAGLAAEYQKGFGKIIGLAPAGAIRQWLEENVNMGSYRENVYPTLKRPTGNRPKMSIGR